MLLSVLSWWQDGFSLWWGFSAFLHLYLDVILLFFSFPEACSKLLWILLSDWWCYWQLLSGSRALKICVFAMSLLAQCWEHGPPAWSPFFVQLYLFAESITGARSLLCGGSGILDVQVPLYAHVPPVVCRRVHGGEGPCFAMLFSKILISVCRGAFSTLFCEALELPNNLPGSCWGISVALYVGENWGRTHVLQPCGTSS